MSVYGNSTEDIKQFIGKDLAMYFDGKGLIPLKMQLKGLIKLLFQKWKNKEEIIWKTK